MTNTKPIATLARIMSLNSLNMWEQNSSKFDYSQLTAEDHKTLSDLNITVPAPAAAAAAPTGVAFLTTQQLPAVAQTTAVVSFEEAALQAAQDELQDFNPMPMTLAQEVCEKHGVAPFAVVCERMDMALDRSATPPVFRWKGWREAHAKYGAALTELGYNDLQISMLRPRVIANIVGNGISASNVQVLRSGFTEHVQSSEAFPNPEPIPVAPAVEAPAAPSNEASVTAKAASLWAPGMPFETWKASIRSQGLVARCSTQFIRKVVEAEGLPLSYDKDYGWRENGAVAEACGRSRACGS